MEFAWQLNAIEAEAPEVEEEEVDTLPGAVRRHARLSPNAPALIEWKPGRRLTTSYATLVRRRSFQESGRDTRGRISAPWLHAPPPPHLHYLTPLLEPRRRHG